MSDGSPRRRRPQLSPSIWTGAKTAGAAHVAATACQSFRGIGRAEFPCFRSGYVLNKETAPRAVSASLAATAGGQGSFHYFFEAGFSSACSRS